MITPANVNLMLTDFIKAEYNRKYSDNLTAMQVDIDDNKVNIIYKLSASADSDSTQYNAEEDFDTVLRRFLKHGEDTKWFNKQVYKNFLGTYITVKEWNFVNTLYGLSSGIADMYLDAVRQLFQILIGNSATVRIVNTARDIISYTLPTVSDRYADRMKTDWFGVIDNYSDIDNHYEYTRNTIIPINNVKDSNYSITNYIFAVIIAAYAKRIEMIAHEMHVDSYLDKSFNYFCENILKQTCKFNIPGHENYCEDILDKFINADNEFDINKLIKSLIYDICKLNYLSFNQFKTYYIDNYSFNSSALKQLKQYISNNFTFDSI